VLHFASVRRELEAGAHPGPDQQARQAVYAVVCGVLRVARQLANVSLRDVAP
jgi:hypothetical protein